MLCFFLYRLRTNRNKKKIIKKTSAGDNPCATTLLRTTRGKALL